MVMVFFCPLISEIGVTFAYGTFFVLVPTMTHDVMKFSANCSSLVSDVLQLPDLASKIQQTTN